MTMEYQIVESILTVGYSGGFPAVLAARKGDFSFWVGAYQGFYFNQVLADVIDGKIKVERGAIPLYIEHPMVKSFYQRYCPSAIPSRIHPHVRDLLRARVYKKRFPADEIAAARAIISAAVTVPEPLLDRAERVAADLKYKFPNDLTRASNAVADALCRPASTRQLQKAEVFLPRPDRTEIKRLVAEDKLPEAQGAVIRALEARRAQPPYRQAFIPVQELESTFEDGAWNVSFYLRSGSYATTFLGIMFDLDGGDNLIHDERTCT